MSSEWPEGLPRNYKELVESEYGAYIAKQVVRYNQVKRNFEDLLQAIWLKLVEADVLSKFAARARSTTPPTMTVLDACGYLGIPFERWSVVVEASNSLRRKYSKRPIPISGKVDRGRKVLLRTSDVVKFDSSGLIGSVNRKYPRVCRPEDFGKTMTTEEACVYWGVNHHPFWQNQMRKVQREAKGLKQPIRPVKGKLEDPTAVIRTRDVDELDQLDRGLLRKSLSDPGFLGARGERQQPRPNVRGFKAYLARAIHNHFANYCRTHNRRCKEHVLAPQAVVCSSSTGYYQAGTAETGTAWEGALVEAMISPEEVVDVVSTIRRAKVDPNSERGVEILDLVAQGHTIQEALRMQQQPRVRLRTRHA